MLVHTLSSRLFIVLAAMALAATVLISGAPERPLPSSLTLAHDMSTADARCARSMTGATRRRDSTPSMSMFIHALSDTARSELRRQPAMFATQQALNASEKAPANIFMSRFCAFAAQRQTEVAAQAEATVRPFAGLR